MESMAGSGNETFFPDTAAVFKTPAFTLQVILGDFAEFWSTAHNQQVPLARKKHFCTCTSPKPDANAFVFFF